MSIFEIEQLLSKDYEKYIRDSSESRIKPSQAKGGELSRRKSKDGGEKVKENLKKGSIKMYQYLTTNTPKAMN